MNPTTEPNASDFKGQRGLQRIINAAGYSKDGLLAAYRHEAAFRQLVLLHGILLSVICFADFDAAIAMMLIGASFLSLITELFNTAIEATIDYISLEKHPLAKRAKDVGSAAQMLALILTAVLWLIALCSY